MDINEVLDSFHTRVNYLTFISAGIVLGLFTNYLFNINTSNFTHIDTVLCITCIALQATLLYKYVTFAFKFTMHRTRVERNNGNGEFSAEDVEKLDEFKPLFLQYLKDYWRFIILILFIIIFFYVKNIYGKIYFTTSHELSSTISTSITLILTIYITIEIPALFILYLYIKYCYKYSDPEEHISPLVTIKLIAADELRIFFLKDTGRKSKLSFIYSSYSKIFLIMSLFILCLIIIYNCLISLHTP